MLGTRRGSRFFTRLTLPLSLTLLVTVGACASYIAWLQPGYDANRHYLESFGNVQSELAAAAPVGSKIEAAYAYLNKRGLIVIFNDQDRIMLATTNSIGVSFFESKRFEVAVFFDSQNEVTGWKTRMTSGPISAHPMRQDFQ